MRIIEVDYKRKYVNLVSFNGDGLFVWEIFIFSIIIICDCKSSLICVRVDFKNFYFSYFIVLTKIFDNCTELGNFSLVLDKVID